MTPRIGGGVGDRPTTERPPGPGPTDETVEPEQRTLPGLTKQAEAEAAEENDADVDDPTGHA